MNNLTTYTSACFLWLLAALQLSAQTTANVTFSVDMSEYTGSFSTVYVSGEFNGWAATANPLSDTDGDSIYTATVEDIAVGTYFYKFQLDGWAAQEFFTASAGSCVADNNGFFDRVLTVQGDTTLPVVCFQSCNACGVAQEKVRLPLDFESTDAAYTIAGFGSADFGPIPAEIVDNPDPSGENTSAKVLKITKPEGAQVWAGASVRLDTVIDLTSGSVFSMKVWSPRADVPVLLKFEDTTSPPDNNGNPSIITEVLMNTTMAGAWETLTFDMSTHPGYDAANQYNQVVIFPDFGNMGVAGGEDFYFDDVQSTGASSNVVRLPLDFELPDTTYQVNGFGAADFGPIPVAVVDNPDPSGENTSAKVLKITKPEGAQVWAGASIPLGAVIDLSGGPVFSMKVWAPRAGTPIQLKFEDTTSPPDANGNPSIIAEVLVNTTMAGVWETLTFDMSTHPGYDPANQYNQVVIFPDFGNVGVAGGEDFYFDDIQEANTAPQLPSLPLDFESADIPYQVNGFGAADFGPIPAEVVDNPDASGENTSAKVLKITKPEGAQVWAGASIPLGTVIDLSGGPVFSMKVWAPRAGTPIQLKFEDTTSPPDANGNPSIIAEVLMNT
ncbi:MAG: hypothetical protein D6730_12795, partial [Bacteroidetes bacterium]